jgi:hypothetical protein
MTRVGIGSLHATATLASTIDSCDLQSPPAPLRQVSRPEPLVRLAAALHVR